ncbi:hypothetical protein [Ligilactobacillus pobuzihii]|uniref:Uncharacterized protein n=1 Tax=Ligilactobacillus pobuzihii TaxID=449659 RepID=A0A0R2L228_9LACO|nr:hypothetical protein [Ligilactobacillus pobuzihii]KRK11215.1 hypothetical protein FD11_GL000912 [Ligilactobacillus pobuzihii E100301 = KCTC 13174]KRN95839.1 hypothetical protein IV66_GL000861 [Ligilactobacillus pobuzihii]GEN47790.1 hypothetical protein LPO01_05820 [Ligilactobacillus pobuzihii]
MRDVRGLPNEDVRKEIAESNISRYFVADMLGLSFSSFKILLAQPLSSSDHERVLTAIQEAKKATMVNA